MLALMERSLSASDYVQVLLVLHEVYSFEPRKQEVDLKEEAESILVILRRSCPELVPIFTKFLQEAMFDSCFCGSA